MDALRAVLGEPEAGARLAAVEGVGPTIAQSILDWFARAVARRRSSTGGARPACGWRDEARRGPGAHARGTHGRGHGRARAVQPRRGQGGDPVPRWQVGRERLEEDRLRRGRGERRVEGDQGARARAADPRRGRVRGAARGRAGGRGVRSTTPPTRPVRQAQGEPADEDEGAGVSTASGHRRRDRSQVADAGALTAEAYLADRLVDADEDYTSELRDAERRAVEATLLVATVEASDGAPVVVGTHHARPVRHVVRRGRRAGRARGCGCWRSPPRRAAGGSPRRSCVRRCGSASWPARGGSCSRRSTR